MNRPVRIEYREPATHNLPADLHPLLARIYASRGLTQAEQLPLELARMHPPTELGGTAAAAELLADMLAGGGRMLIVGDFDADGATSTALALRALRAMGAGDVDYLVPNRFDYGYGLSVGIVEEALKRRPDLIITVDNGIANHDGVAAAHAGGAQVLITDHHLPAATLPAAEVIVNPNLTDEGFPSKSLAGVGVIFYVMIALRAELRRRGWFEARGIAEPNLAGLLDLVALGTVADVVPLDRNNRVLVAEGIKRIRARACCPGILALLQVGQRQPERLVASDLGFAVGPRLNAAGRLEDMSIGIECLLTDDPDRALQLAAELDSLNRQRREIEGDMQQQAEAWLEQLSLAEDELPWGLVLHDPAWHQGVVGILASRIKERHHRPVIAFAEADDGQLRGSARSISGLHIRDVLEAIDARHPGLLVKFGGHAMAAGMTLSDGSLAAFRAAFDAEVRRQLNEADLAGVIFSDGQLQPDWFELELAHLLRDAGPWGQHFPEPTFDGRFRVLQQRVLQDKHRKLVLSPLDDPGRLLDGIAFNQFRPGQGDLPEQVTLAYRLDVNEYRGRESLQLMIEHIFE